MPNNTNKKTGEAGPDQTHKKCYLALELRIAEYLGLKQVSYVESLQSLWSGFGEIVRIEASGTRANVPRSLIVKYVQVPAALSHPRGWNSSYSHQRKIHSYHVESHWYGGWSKRCDPDCYVPKVYMVDSQSNDFLFVLEDLDASGFSRRVAVPSLISVTSSASRDCDVSNRKSLFTDVLRDVRQCLRWLAYFHARFMSTRGVDSEHSDLKDLWPTGSYWHLATRQEELEALEDSILCSAAPKIDKVLNSAVFQTLIHGDAKIANFCFAEKDEGVAAVDFQYVGKGCGMKDVALLLSSCFDADACFECEEPLLQYYFEQLRLALEKNKNTLDFTALESEWRGLYYYAWADFVRFLKGWSPGHWKVHRYSEKMTQRVIQDPE